MGQKAATLCGRWLATCASGIRWLVMLGLLAMAIHLKDPYLLPFRPFETFLLIMLSCSGIAIYRRRPQGIGRTLGLALLWATLALTVYGEISFRYRKYVVLNGAPATLVPLGGHFIVGYGPLDELRPLVSKGLVAGIFVTRHNVAGHGIQELRQEISELQALRKDAGLPRLIITTDQEGGGVSRLSPPLVWLPGLASLLGEKLTPSEWLAKAEAYGQKQGQDLADIGVTVNFSPVVDLKSQAEANFWDFHSHINQRSISADPALTAAVAQAYVRGLASQGVKATLKHFPGLGQVPNDTHHFSAKLEAPVSELAAHDWIPFRQIAASTDALIMLGHVVLTAMDGDNPVSFSKKAVQQIFRTSWQYEGALITDDLTMRSAYQYGLCEVTVKALNAGVDLLLISYDYEQFYEAMHCAARAYENGALDKKMLDDSRHRLSRLGL